MAEVDENEAPGSSDAHDDSWSLQSRLRRVSLIRRGLLLMAMLTCGLLPLAYAWSVLGLGAQKGALAARNEELVEKSIAIEQRVIALDAASTSFADYIEKQAGLTAPYPPETVERRMSRLRSMNVCGASDERRSAGGCRSLGLAPIVRYCDVQHDFDAHIVSFAVGRSELSPFEEGALAEWVRGVPKDAILRVEVFHDLSGSEEANRRIVDDRASSVLDVLRQLDLRKSRLQLVPRMHARPDFFGRGARQSCFRVAVVTAAVRFPQGAEQ